VVSVVIPTYNASPYLDAQLKALRAQTVKDLEILVIDSSSSDETLDIAKQHAIQTVIIPKREFDHGGTRTLAGKTRSVGDILVYLTQDALPCDDRAIETLIQPLVAEQKCGAAFGRQIPCQNATPFAQHLRLFNYPQQSYTRTYADRTALVSGRHSAQILLRRIGEIRLRPLGGSLKISSSRKIYMYVPECS